MNSPAPRCWARVLAFLLVVDFTAAARTDLPSDAMSTGVPTLLSKKTANKWKAWRGPSLLAFYGRGKQSMGLKQLGKEYKGRLPIGGVRPEDTELQQLFGVQAKELPTILVMQNGSPTMRLGGGTDPSTLRTLINSALGSHASSGSSGGMGKPTASAGKTVKVPATAMQQRCEERKGICILLATSLATPRTTVELLTKQLAGKNVVHVDSHDRQVAALIKKAGLPAGTPLPDAAMMVVKGRAGQLPRMARYSGRLDDRLGLVRFFEDLKAGLLSFDTFQWPDAPTADKDADDFASRQQQKQEQHGQNAQPNDSHSQTSSHSTHSTDHVAGQYRNVQSADAIEEIVLNDED